MDEEVYIRKVVARAVAAAVRKWGGLHPESVQAHGVLAVGITADEYKPELDSLVSSITDPELASAFTNEAVEKALRFLDQNGCFEMRDAGFGRNYGLWKIDLGQLAQYD